MGTIMGNILAAIFIIIAALTGFLSLKISLITFLFLAYGLWLLVWAINLLASPSHGADFLQFLTCEEKEIYERFHLYFWAPGASEAFSCMLNGFRLAGIIWAGLAFWNELYLLGGFCIAFFFVIGGIVVKLSPTLYVGRSAQSGNGFAQSQVLLMQAVQRKRELYNSESVPNDNDTITKLQNIVQDWPDDQAEGAIRVVKCVLEGKEFDEYFGELTVSQVEVVNEILQEIEGDA